MAILKKHPALTLAVFILLLFAGWTSLGMFFFSGGTAILSVHDDSLTSYLPSGATNTQDVRPQVGQRGVNLDGSVRAGPSFPMAMAGNPFESTWRGGPSAGIVASLGTFRISDVDLSLPAPGFRWTIGRSYNARQLD